MTTCFCRKCETNKPLSEFKPYRKHICAECLREQARLRYAKQKKVTKANSRLQNDYLRNYRLSAHGRTILLINKAKFRAKNKNLKFEISYGFIRQKLENGKCEKTGIEFTFENNEKSFRNPYSPSIDKIDPFGDYIEDNIQVVCNFYNTSKGQMTDDEFLKFCRQVVDYQKENNDEF